MKKLLLFSGGMDSFIAYKFIRYYMHHNDSLMVLYIDYGGMYCKKEMDVIHKLIPEVIVDGSLYLGDQEGRDGLAFIPYRNLSFALLAMKYDPDEIIMAGMEDDNCIDKTPTAFEDFSRILSTYGKGKQVIVSSPFWNKSKVRAIKWYLETIGKSGRALDLLLKTTSCYDPQKHYCGECRACFRKWCALWGNGIRISFYNRGLIQDYFERAKDGSFYTKERNELILKVVNESMGERHE
jgi:7-cyano-7-deazaguanine synthase in queuosine biosynthesis